MSIRFPLFIGSNCLTADTKNKTTYFIRCENPPLCWLKLLLLLLLLLLKLNLALLASKPPFPGNSYGYCGTILHFCARHTTTTTTFWLRLPITLQATQFRATAIRSQMNMKGVCFHKKNSYLKLKYWSFIWWNSVLLLPISIAIFLWFKRKHKFVKVKEKLSNWGLGWTICKRHHSFTKWQSVSVLFSNIMKWEKVKVKRYARKPLKSYVIMICNVKSLIGTYSKVNISNTNIQYQDCSQMSQFPFFFFQFWP